MKITMLTYGSQGDVEPFVALGYRLCQAGHAVRLAGPEAYQSRYDLRDIDYIPLPGDPAFLVQELAEKAGTNRLQMVSRMSRFVIPLAVQVFNQSRMACRDADLILHSFLLTSTGISLGNELGIPNMSAQFFPVFTSTSEFPAPTFLDLPLGGAYRNLTHKIVSLTFKWGSRLLYSWIRSKNPSLPKLTGWIPGDCGHQEIPILYGFSSQVVPRPKDWTASAHITGYWLIDPILEGDPPQELIDFVLSGPPPITVAFGSTRTSKLKETKQKVVDALAACDQRGIIIGDMFRGSQGNPNLLQVDYAPYSWLFKRSAAVIHHGGAGTTAKGLMAGVPNIILPFTSDQPFWGRRVSTLGAGPKPIPARRLSPDRLIKAINQVVNDQNMSAQARRIGDRISGEDGCSQAVRIIEDHLEKAHLRNLCEEG